MTKPNTNKKIAKKERCPGGRKKVQDKLFKSYRHSNFFYKCAPAPQCSKQGGDTVDCIAKPYQVRDEAKLKSNCGGPSVQRKEYPNSKSDDTLWKSWKNGQYWYYRKCRPWPKPPVCGQPESYPGGVIDELRDCTTQCITKHSQAVVQLRCDVDGWGGTSISVHV